MIIENKIRILVLEHLRQTDYEIFWEYFDYLSYVFTGFYLMFYNNHKTVPLTSLYDTCDTSCLSRQYFTLKMEMEIKFYKILKADFNLLNLSHYHFLVSY